MGANATDLGLSDRGSLRVCGRHKTSACDDVLECAGGTEVRRPELPMLDAITTVSRTQLQGLCVASPGDIVRLNRAVIVFLAWLVRHQAARIQLEFAIQVENPSRRRSGWQLDQITEASEFADHLARTCLLGGVADKGAPFFVSYRMPSCKIFQIKRQRRWAIAPIACACPSRGTSRR